MAILKMKRLRLMLVRSQKEELLKELARLGCVQVSEISEEVQEQESEGLVRREGSELSKLKTQQGTLERAVELLKRYTSVQPNPATETAKVISSFGLTRIEAFNSAGDRVYDAPHTGLTATLDVSRWPAGTYILRLHTPAGTVGKKLIVRR